jgi:ComF family protein
MAGGRGAAPPAALRSGSHPAAHLSRLPGGGRRQRGALLPLLGGGALHRAALCPVYGTPFAYQLGEDIVSAEALADPPPFRRARAAAIYGDIARSLVHHLKYHDRPELAQVMAIAMGRAGRTLIADCALIVPVPLYRWRLWQRRFNQAAALVACLASLSGLPHDPLVLQRVKPTRRQVGLSATQREENVRGAFRVPDSMRARIAAQPVLLVDDVYTSGATAKAATRALLRAGAAAVDVLTFARVTSVN